LSGFLGSGLTIGNVTLAGFEVPDTVPWGTEQLLKEHVYPGGQNFIQPMGPTREPIEWSGQLFDTPFGRATDRAHQLDALCSAGKPLALMWGDLHFHVVIKKFRLVYKHQWQGHYTMSCAVIWDYPPPPNAPSAITATSNDLHSASGLLTQSQSQQFNNVFSK
jgi:hypothetical protein